MKPFIRNGEELSVNVSDHSIDYCIAHSNAIMASRATKVLIEELDTYTMRAPQVSHSRVFTGFDDSDSSGIVFVYNAPVAGR